MRCCDIHAGLLNKRISLQSEELTDDGGGGFVKTWTETAAVWAWIKPLSGGESLYGMQLEEKITHDVIMRYRPGVDAKMSILFNSRRFNIKSVINLDEMSVWLVLRCEEGGAS